MSIICIGDVSWSLRALHTDIIAHHRIVYSYFTRIHALGTEFASKSNVTKTLDPLFEHNEAQVRLTRLAMRWLCIEL
jgi:hypothetical protein